MKFTKIVATIGPATDSVSQIKKLYHSGMNVARLNFSHGSHEYFDKVIKNIRKVSNEIAIMLDTKGPEIRIGDVENNSINLVAGDYVIFTKEKLVGNKNKITINYANLHKLKKGDSILIDDGNIEAVVVKKIKQDIKIRIINGGVLSSRKTVSLKGHNVEINFISKKDKEDIDFGIKNNLDFIAASFVRKKEDVLEIKKYLDKRKSKIRIISKIEHWEALNNLDEIIEISQGIMVARGDLAVEIPMEQVPKFQKQIIKHCNELGKPVIVATQMLESMINNPRPTRAEISDVAQAILDGTDAVMLSAETTIGKYPIKAVEMMTKIANEYDKEVQNTIIDNKHSEEEISKNSISMFVTKSAYVASTALNISAIITPTESGYTARKVSRFKPKCPIFAITRDESVLRQLGLSWGVFPFKNSKKYRSVDKMVYQTIRFIYDKKLIKKEDKIVITSGHNLAKSGLTNSLEIYNVKDILDNLKR